MMIIILKDTWELIEIKWIKLLEAPQPLDFNHNIYHEVNISRLPDLKVCFLF